ncbi:hypothetical protein FA95DRAFT_1502085 [Auriscalpium vulgare]|uniref:Uncharacterized protein n=1 Tax=Auriscalpium vulgare TaxID=40419 RepID=A0ACB8RBC0_9AGAM|nr:hypothetical protein FA95DRAFT_1502085 [Auriscalpium vulgare]
MTTRPNQPLLLLRVAPLILETISFECLAVCRGVCREWRRTSEIVLLRRWEAYLSDFIFNPLWFRAVLRATASVVSGSTVLHFLLKHSSHESSWTPGDLDIFCPITSAESMLFHLTKFEGYRNKNSTEDIADGRDDYLVDNTGGLFQVIHLERPDGREIDLVVSTRQSPLSALTYFWGTIVLNYVSADTICVSYPLWTLAGIGRLHPERSSFRHARLCVDKYHGRGFQLHTFDSKQEPTYHSIYCPRSYRTFFDRSCLRFSFDAPSGLPLYQVRPPVHPVWRYGGDACQADCIGDRRYVLCLQGLESANIV